MPPLQVEVFPIARMRWIAVIEAPMGPFSTEATGPELIADEVVRAIREVLGTDAEHVLVDERGRAWGVDLAREQLRRLVEDARPLTNPEREILDALLELDFAGADVLRRQALTVAVTARCECGCPTVDLTVQETLAPSWVAEASPPRSEVQVPVHGRSRSDDDQFEVILWVRHGKLSLLEYVGLPGSHTTWPSPADLDIWTA